MLGITESAIKYRISCLKTRWRAAIARMPATIKTDAGEKDEGSLRAAEDLMEARARVCKHYRKLNEYFSSRCMEVGGADEVPFIDMGTGKPPTNGPTEQENEKNNHERTTEGETEQDPLQVEVCVEEMPRVLEIKREKDLNELEQEIRRPEREKRVLFRREEERQQEQHQMSIAKKPRVSWTNEMTNVLVDYLIANVPVLRVSQILKYS